MVGRLVDWCLGAFRDGRLVEFGEESRGECEENVKRNDGPVVKWSMSCSFAGGVTSI